MAERKPQCSLQSRFLRFKKNEWIVGMIEYDNPTPVAVHLQMAFCHSKSMHGLVVIKRVDNGLWALPGGYIESTDKSAEDAAAREFYEETRIIACPGTLMYSTITPSKRILIFSKSNDVFTLNLNYWVSTDEASEIRIAFEPEELCYPAHTDAMKRWFDALI